MLINNIYDYQPLKRVEGEGGRKYIVGESKPIPSVTTILSATKDLTHLKEWVARVGKTESERIKTEASGLGSGMHNNLEKYILGQPLTGSFMSKTLANLIIKEGLSKVNEVWGCEVGLFAKDLYAGTADLIGLHEGTPAIMDFKNSLKEKKKEWIEDYFMQLSAYALAHNEMFNTNISKGVIMLATREAKYQEFVIEGDEFIHYQTKWAEKVCEYYSKFG
jgi:hypothetical protein